MLSEQERAEYVGHLQRVLGELATLLDGAPLGEDQPVIQRAFDELRAIRERLLAAPAPEPEPVYQRLARLERQATAQGYLLRVDEHGLVLWQRRAAPPGTGLVRTFACNDAGIQAAFAWLKERPEA